MKCPHCHADNQDGRFCRKCGAPLNDDAADLTRVMPPLGEAHAAEASEATALPSADNKEMTPPSPETASADQDKACIKDTPSDASGAAANDENDVTRLLSDTDRAALEPLEATCDHAAITAEMLPVHVDTESADKDDASPAKRSLLARWRHKQAQPTLEETADSADEETQPPSRRKKRLTQAALVIGIFLAAIAAFYLFTNFIGTTPPADPNASVKNADTIAPDTSLAEDTIVGHWRHYNTGSTIEKIGTARYRWTIDKDVYQLDFKDNQYVYEDEAGNIYNFVLVSADRLQLASSTDANGGLITNSVFESGYLCGRVGQDGSMTQNMSVNADAFNIVGKTYAELAGLYGPGALSVVGDEQYIIFRADGGNFAVQFTGETVPLNAEGKDYDIVRLSNENVTPPNNETGNEPTDPGTGTTPGTGGGTETPPPATDNNTEEENKEYKVEIPDMPTFPSNSAVATGVVWADLGFVIKNAPSSLSVEDLSAVLGIALEVGTAPANESGFAFYGMSEGYFAGTYASGDHSFYISGYGKTALNPDKTILFLQQIS